MPNYIILQINQIIRIAGSRNKNKNWSSAPTKNRCPQGYFEGQNDVPLSQQNKPKVQIEESPRFEAMQHYKKV